MRRFLLSAVKKARRPELQPIMPKLNLKSLKKINIEDMVEFFIRKNPQGFGRFNRRRGKKKEVVDKREEYEEELEEKSNRKEAQEKEKEKTTEEKKAEEDEEELKVEEEKKEEKKELTPEEQAKEFKKQLEKEFEKLLGRGNKDSKEGNSKKPKTKIIINESNDSKDSKSKFSMGSGGGDPNNQNIFTTLRNFLIIYFIISLISSSDDVESERKEIAFEYFENDFLNKGLISEITIERGIFDYSPKFVVNFDTKDGNFRTPIANVDHFLKKLEELQREKGIEEKDFIRVKFMHNLAQHKKNQNAERVRSGVLSLAITGLIFFLIRRTMKSAGAALKNMQRRTKGDEHKLTKEGLIKPSSELDVYFKDVAGMEEAKKEIMEFVDFLKHAEKYNKLGAQIPKGALLTGPPGTGKTMLAKACSKEAGVPFFYMSGSEFVERYVGVGASRVRQLFDLAKKESPCIIFIDEIDAVGGKRSTMGGMGGNIERENTLNQLLVELDGFATDQNVVLFGATNMKDSLDPALLRPGRFDRDIEITLPDIEAREKIFKVHLAKIKLSDEKTMDQYAQRLATLTPGFSGAEIANICNEAAIIAARAKADAVSPFDFEMAVERVIGGLEKKRIPSEDERRVVAIHESGHGVVSWFLEGGLPLLKLTIIPRSKGALGFAQYLPNETQLERKKDLVDRLCSILGGRIAEELLVGRITTGATDDLDKIHDLAHQIVTKFGMDSNNRPFYFKEDQYGNKAYSEKTSRQIDFEKEKLIRECTEKTRNLVMEHKDKIMELSEVLLEKETIDFKTIYGILGERPFKPRNNFKKYLEEVLEEFKDNERGVAA